MKLLITIIFCAYTITAFATIDTVNIYSNCMKKSSKAVVILPNNYRSTTLAYATTYILHGYNGKYNNWIKNVPQLQDYSNMYNQIIVCPDGNTSSWYLNSPIDSNYMYETYITNEVVDFIDQHYNTIKNKTGRAITGLSMGGHGGLYLGWRNSSIFGACGSMSGGVDLHYSRNKFDVAKRIGSVEKYPENWKKYSVLYLIENKTEDSLAIIFDCGVDDFFYNDNKALHAKMLELKINHDYIERPGKHDWAYWRNAVNYQLLFFHKYFLSAKTN